MSRTRVAVLLAGPGQRDGSDIHEASAMLAAIERRGAEYQCYALDQVVKHTFDHFSETPRNLGRRNMMVEAARISRGEIQNLERLNVERYEALLVPGGMGCVMEFCRWAMEGWKKRVVDEHVEATLHAFKSANKPIGLCSEAALISCFLYPDAKQTLGQLSDDYPAPEDWPFSRDLKLTVEHLNVNHHACRLPEIAACNDSKIFTAPASLNRTAKIHEIHDNVENLVNSVFDSVEKVETRKNSAKSQTKIEKKPRMATKSTSKKPLKATA